MQEATIPRDGSGDYARAVTPPNNGDVASATDFNTELNDIGQALSDSVNINGTKAYAANQPMGGFKFTGLAAGASNGDSVRYEQLTGLPYQASDATLTALAALSWSSGNALIQFTAADTVSLTLTPSVTDLTLSGELFASAGSATDPSIAFAGDPNTGLFNVGADQIGFTVGGATRATFTTNNFDFTQVISATDGSASSPGFRFRSDTNNGAYRIGTDNWGLSAGGSKIVDIATTGIAITGTLSATGAARLQAPISTDTGGTLTSASDNAIVDLATAPTINDGVHAAGAIIVLVNNTASSMTITQDTGMTLRLHGTTTTGNRTLAARGVAQVLIDPASNAEAIVLGDVT